MTNVNIDDLRLAARRRLPKLSFDYIDGGSFAKDTHRRDWDDVDHRAGFGIGALKQAANLSRRIDKKLAWKDS